MNVTMLINEANAIALKLRLGKNVEAGLDIVSLLEKVVKISATTSHELQQQVKFIITQILHCQESQDWLGLADYLQYELVYLLGNIKNN